MAQAPAPDILHGGRLIAARRRYVGAPEPFIDLSTSINPNAYPIRAIPPACLTRLPEPEEEQALLAAAVQCYGIANPSMVVAAPGTQAIISLLPLLNEGARVGVLVPTYGEHLASWGSAATAVHSLAALAGFDVAVLCNPNNPDGRVIAAERLLSLAANLARGGGFLLVDEAFADFMPGVSLAGYLPHPGLILLRSFGKAFGLAGVRLGFALANPPYIAALRHSFGCWAVSGPALWAGCQALSDQVWFTQARLEREEAAVRLDRLLETADLRVVGGTPLFRLVQAGAAGAVADHLGAAGILVRTFAEHPTWLRFGVPAGEPHWQRLQLALNSWS